MSKVSAFNIIFSYLANKKPFRISKKGIPTNIFKKVEDKRNNQMEVKIESNDVNDEQKSMRINLKRGKGSKKKESNFNMQDEDPK